MIGYLWRNGVGPVAIGALVIGAIAAAASITRGRTRGRSAWNGLLAACAAGTLGVTLGRSGSRLQFSPQAVAVWAPDGWSRFTADLGRSEEIWLNVALFTPLAALLTWRTRRPLTVSAGIAGASVAIECVQGIFGLGNPDLSDVYANSLGAFLACTATGIALLATGRSGRGTRCQSFGMAAMILIAAGCVPFAAHRHQDHEMAALETRYDGTTLASVRHWLRHGSTANDLFRLGPIYSDGSTQSATSVIIRYPTSYLGVSQCVLAGWTDDGFSVTPASGTRCTVFME